jgi:hypothetical protein
MSKKNLIILLILGIIFGYCSLIYSSQPKQPKISIVSRYEVADFNSGSSSEGPADQKKHVENTPKQNIPALKIVLKANDIGEVNIRILITKQAKEAEKAAQNMQICSKLFALANAELDFGPTFDGDYANHKKRKIAKKAEEPKKSKFSKKPPRPFELELSPLAQSLQSPQLRHHNKSLETSPSSRFQSPQIGQHSSPVESSPLQDSPKESLQTGSAVKKSARRFRRMETNPFAANGQPSEQVEQKEIVEEIATQQPFQIVITQAGSDSRQNNGHTQKPTSPSDIQQNGSMERPAIDLKKALISRKLGLSLKPRPNQQTEARFKRPEKPLSRRSNTKRSHSAKNRTRKTEKLMKREISSSDKTHDRRNEKNII